MIQNTNCIIPNWPAPKRVQALTSLRNCGDLINNRDLIKTTFNLPSDPIWLKQIHSNIVVKAHPDYRNHEADASFTDEANRVCLVFTADCLPILLCNQAGTEVAAIHAGWRGLASGVIESTLSALKSSPQELLAWIGPGISQKNYEVGNEVRQQFLTLDPQLHEAFIPSLNQRWLVDLYSIARFHLNKRGINKIFGGNFCTYDDAERFYSFRRDGQNKGRLASLIWIAEP